MVEAEHPASTQPNSGETVPRGKALVIDGVSYDIGVKLCGTNRLFLLEKHFEDVKAPGLLRQAAEAKVGCPGCLEDEEEGITWSSRYPLEKKGCYIFFPHKEDSFLTWAFTAPLRAFTASSDPPTAKDD
ncbi:g1066 [Coccomyxa viridis]|uniref:G1066 protein n=1 Tax=Coccomyxa viridis TaxID=1274662 RepID=A0ABP1FIT7_9CHLO